MYLDFEFFIDTFGGEIEEVKFKSLNIQAEAILDYYTFGRVKELAVTPLYVKYAVCELVKSLNDAEKQQGLKSEKIGTYSVTYGQHGNSTTQHKVILHRWLPNELLYRGTESKKASVGAWKDVY